MPPVDESDVKFILLLKRFQSAEERIPELDVPAVVRENDTFGPTVAPVPFMTVSSGIAEVIFPNVSAFCFALKFDQSIDESAPVWIDEARASERFCPERNNPFPEPIVRAS